MCLSCRQDIYEKKSKAPHRIKNAIHHPENFVCFGSLKVSKGDVEGVTSPATMTRIMFKIIHKSDKQPIQTSVFEIGSFAGKRFMLTEFFFSVKMLNFLFEFLLILHQKLNCGFFHSFHSWKNTIKNKFSLQCMIVRHGPLGSWIMAGSVFIISNDLGFFFLKS